MGEHLPCKQGVTSSNLVISTQTIEQAHSHLLMDVFQKLVFVNTDIDKWEDICEMSVMSAKHESREKLVYNV